MIRIERGSEVSPGIWEYRIPSLSLSGRSRQPLLDACRQIKRMGGAPNERAGVFRDDRSEPDIFCPVWAGAEVTVSDPPAGGGCKFAKFQEFTAISKS
jgi:hypothetical protein